MLEFYKVEATGNDFVLVESKKLQKSLSSQDIYKLCHRQFGVGADGLLLIEPSTLADVKMRIFNQDGHEASMCGNGLRCITAVLQRKHLSIETIAGIYHCEYSNNQIVTDFKLPYKISTHTIHCPYAITYHKVDAGAPHAVVQDEGDLWDSFNHWAPILRKDPLWSPVGTNVTCFRVVCPNQLAVRVFEKGVEAETLSCGSGVASAAWVHYQNNESPDSMKIEILLMSKQKLDVFIERTEKSTTMHITGPARVVFHGTIDLNQL